jgi:hypothetical protein
MNKRFLFSFILGMIAVGILYSQEIQTSATVDSLSSHGSLRLWLDGGVYPRLPSEAGAFEPVNSIRIGAGKQFSIYGIYGFLELTNYTFENHYGLSALATSNRRYDMAIYGVGSFLQIFYVGIGAHYTHQDNIVIQWIHGYENNATVESGPRTYLGFYYLIGLGYPIRIFDGVSLPIGLYYRTTREYNYKGLYSFNYTPMFDYNNTSLALQIGIVYSYGE